MIRFWFNYRHKTFLEQEQEWRISTDCDSALCYLVYVCYYYVRFSFKFVLLAKFCFCRVICAKAARPIDSRRRWKKLQEERRLQMMETHKKDRRPSSYRRGPLVSIHFAVPTSALKTIRLRRWSASSNPIFLPLIDVPRRRTDGWDIWTMETKQYCAWMPWKHAKLQ